MSIRWSGYGTVLFAAASVLSAQTAGEPVYQKRCALCHDHPDARIPPKEALKSMTTARIMRTLDFGVMMSIAYPMTRDEREAVAGYLGRPGAAPPPAPAAFCAERTMKLSASAPGDWNGWSPSQSNTRYQTTTSAGLNVDQVRGLKLKWAFGFEGDITAFAPPTILGKYIFVGSAGGRIYSLAAATGCIHWYFEANGPVRTALVAAPLRKNHALMFSDQTGWVYAIDAETGKQLWKKRVEEHEAARLTGSPVVYRDVVYFPAASWEETRATNPDYECCTFRGSISALRVKDGSLVWKTYTIADPPKPTAKAKTGTQMYGPSGAGVWSAPTIDTKRGLLYIATGDNYSSPATTTSDAVMALDLKSGKIAWTKQTFPNDAFNSSCGNSAGGGTQTANCPEENGPDYDFGASVMLQKDPDGKDMLFAGQKSAVVYALDPDKNGEIIWQTRVGRGSASGGVQWGMSTDGQRVYAAVSDAVRVRGQFDPAKGGGITALRLNDGGQVWHNDGTPCAPPKPDCSPAQGAALTAIPGVIFSGSLDGHLRALAAEDGKVLWDMDTARDFQTVNGIKAHGGSLDGPGAVISNGIVYVTSGYPRFGGMPGNVLLAFEPAK